MCGKCRIYVILLAIISLLASCDKMLLVEEEINNPVNNFDNVWENFDQYYGGFIVKNINWDSLYQVYHPMIDDNSTEEELFNALSGLLGELNDSHVFLKTLDPSLGTFVSGIRGELQVSTDFKQSTVEGYYLIESTKLNDNLWYGKLSNNIGYILLTSFTEEIETYERDLETAIINLQNTNGLVIDIRNNKGGFDPQAMYVAGHFATEKKVAFSFKLRNGIAHNDFTDPIEVSFQPEGEIQYSKDIVVLTNRFTISAGEAFTLAISTLDNVTLVGDTTTGAFSDAIRRDMPNGWMYRMSVGEWRDHNGVCWEGIGFPPDVVIQNNPADVTNGYDEALEKAIELLK